MQGAMPTEGGRYEHTNGALGMVARGERPLHATAWQKKSAHGEPWALRKPGNNLLSRKSTIIGGTCLTTVFGMGTGMARCLSSPGMRAGQRSR